MQEELDRLKQKRTILDRKIADQEEKIQTIKTEEIMEVVSSVNISPSQLKELLATHFSSGSDVDNTSIFLEENKKTEGIENAEEKN